MRRPAGLLLAFAIATSAPAEAARSSAATVEAISLACGSSSPAASVGSRPRAERVNSFARSWASSCRTCRPSVGCVSRSARAAPDRLPWSATARNERSNVQSIGSRAMQKCISESPLSAI